MDFFMPYCKNKPSLLSILWVLLTLLILCPAVAGANGIAVHKAEIRKTEAGYQLAAHFEISLTHVLEQALTHGINLDFVSEFYVTRSRWYWLGEVASKTAQSTKLSYSALTRQYRIKRGSLFQNFATKEEALRVLGNQFSHPIATQLLKKDGGYFESLFSDNSSYTATARMRLDVSQLPKPLQVNALTNDEWRLDSGTYDWILTPAEIAQARKKP